MTLFEMRVPQLGEGLQEARVVRFLKSPGDAVSRDEPIYEMETDKAVTEVESPCAGTLESWTVAVDSIVAIGDVIARISTNDPVDIESPAKTESGASTGSPTRAVNQYHTIRNVIPPRTRAYARKHGISDETLLAIPAAGKRLVPADIDAYLAEKAASADATPAAADYEDVPMSTQQRTLFYRLTRAQQQVVPGTIELEIPWEPIETAHAWYKSKVDRVGGVPSRSLMVAWCIVQTVADHSKFRSVVLDVNSVRRYRHTNIGIAVALPEDELTSAVVPAADTLTFEEFIKTARARIAEARVGKDQASETVVHVAFSSMEAFGVFTAVPVVVPPSVATIFLGAPHTAVVGAPGGELKTRRATHMTMTFDHRVINGVAAANFMLDLRKRIENLPQMCEG
jgi:pyruvate dehydrogenase E2 component (dihydrolipoamide acetyltransferase)